MPPGAKIIDTGLITQTYTRKLDYGQIKSMKALLKLLKRLKVSKKLVDITFNQVETTMGSPGKDTYRVRIRYSE